MHQKNNSESHKSLYILTAIVTRIELEDCINGFKAQKKQTKKIKTGLVVVVCCGGRRGGGVQRSVWVGVKEVIRNLEHE